MQLTKAQGKVALLAGSALVFLALASVEAISFSEFRIESFMVAAGAITIIAGLLALAN